MAEDKFKVIFKNNNLPYQAYSRTHYLPEMSYVSADGNNWSDITLQNKTVCLKVYTLKDDAKIIDNNDISVDYDSRSYFSVKVVTDDGHAVGAGEKVKFTINGKNITVLTDDDGIAKFEINEVPGTYVITSSCNNQTYQNKVTVKLNPNTCKVIDNKDITVDYNSDAYFTVKVVSSDGKVAASKVPVTFKINGEDTTVKTDKNGIATLNCLYWILVSIQLKLFITASASLTQLLYYQILTTMMKTMMCLMIGSLRKTCCQVIIHKQIMYTPYIVHLT